MKWTHIAYAAILLLLWTGLLGFMYRRETALEEQRLTGIALSQARALFNEVADLRAWNSSHGGVYVPITQSTPSNSLLEAPERDITTVSGRRLTLLNHAYMTRQLAEITRARRGIALHLTSLKPLRPENEPEPWERAALESFEGGTPEHANFVRDAEGREIFRYMAPLRAEASCIPCHAQQGYRVGQVRGGLSVVSSVTALAASRQAFRASAAFASVVIWLLGAGLMAAAAIAYRGKNLLVTRLRELALVDDLTGLHNRRGFRLLAEKQLQIAWRTGHPEVLLFIDLDRMKLINDEHGHKAGDAALRRVAAVLRAAFRTSDIIARLSGDEFIVLCPDTGPDSMPTLLEALEQHVGDANAGAAVPWRISLSVGTALFDTTHPATLDELMSEADAAMYAAKQRKQAARPTT